MTRPLLGAALLGAALLVGACGTNGEEASPERLAALQQRQRNLEAAKAKHEQSAATKQSAAPTEPIATAKVEKWPGLEARLMRVERNGNLISTEVQLVNTGSAPVTVRDYSASGATIVDPERKMEYEVFTQAHTATVTENLTATLEPGQQTTVFAIFAAPQSDRITIKLPELPAFENVPVRRRGQRAPANDPKATNEPARTQSSS